MYKKIFSQFDFDFLTQEGFSFNIDEINNRNINELYMSEETFYNGGYVPPLPSPHITLNMPKKRDSRKTAPNVLKRKHYNIVSYINRDTPCYSCGEKTMINCVCRICENKYCGKCSNLKNVLLCDHLKVSLKSL